MDAISAYLLKVLRNYICMDIRLTVLKDQSTYSCNIRIKPSNKLIVLANNTAAHMISTVCQDIGM